MRGLNTYVYNEEVEPAPRVGEVLDKAVCHPLQQHFQDEDVGEDLVCVFQHCFDGPPLLDVYVLKRLYRMEEVMKTAGENNEAEVKVRELALKPIERQRIDGYIDPRGSSVNLTYLPLDCVVKPQHLKATIVSRAEMVNHLPNMLLKC